MIRVSAQGIQGDEDFTLFSEASFRVAGLVASVLDVFGVAGELKQ